MRLSFVEDTKMTNNTIIQDIRRNRQNGNKQKVSAGGKKCVEQDPMYGFYFLCCFLSRLQTHRRQTPGLSHHVILERGSPRSVILSKHPHVFCITALTESNRDLHAALKALPKIQSSHIYYLFFDPVLYM